MPGSARLQNNYGRFLMGGFALFYINLRNKRKFFDHQLTLIKFEQSKLLKHSENDEKTGENADKVSEGARTDLLEQVHVQSGLSLR